MLILILCLAVGALMIGASLLALLVAAFRGFTFSAIDQQFVQRKERPVRFWLEIAGWLFVGICGSAALYVVKGSLGW